jgi:hypothetical protein
MKYVHLWKLRLKKPKYLKRHVHCLFLKVCRDSKFISTRPLGYVGSNRDMHDRRAWFLKEIYELAYILASVIYLINWAMTPSYFIWVIQVSFFKQKVIPSGTTKCLCPQKRYSLLDRSAPTYTYRNWTVEKFHDIFSVLDRRRIQGRSQRPLAFAFSPSVCIY